MLVSACLLLAVLLGCVASSPDSVWEALRSLSQESGVASSSDTTVFLVMSPSQCTICNHAVSRLKVWRDTSPTTRSYRLVLSRPPRDEERTVLARFRMNPDFILEKAGLTSRGPVVVLETQGRQISQAVGPNAVSVFVERPGFLTAPASSPKSQ